MKLSIYEKGLLNHIIESYIGNQELFIINLKNIGANHHRITQYVEEAKIIQEKINRVGE